MIGYLEGKVRYATKGEIVLQTSGIGFTVRIPESLQILTGSTLSIYIHTHLREDELSLYGFESFEDLKLFELLISVSGVGPRIGLAIFSVATASVIKEAISSSNLAFFTSISGVGKKTAQKIILDLKSKISKGDISLESLEGKSELMDSLAGLGFTKTEISQVITQIDTTAELPKQIKQALKLLS